MAKKLKRRADGRYAKQITIGIVDGKQKKKTVYGRTIPEVEKKYRDFLQLYEKGIILSSDNITLEELMNEWYQLKKANYIQFNTKLSYETRMKVIHRTIGILPIKTVKTYHIQSLMNDMIREGHTASAKLMLIMLSNIFDYAITIDLLYKNPCKAVQIKHTILPKRILTSEEKRNVLNADLNLRDRALLALLRYTGIRRGELLALTRKDIDFDRSCIQINKTLIDVKGKGKINHHTKTDAGMRTIPILQNLKKPLLAYLESLGEQQEFLFLNQVGNLYTANGGYYLLNRIRTLCSLGDDVTFHTFRHTFITECYQAGVPVKKLQAWVGHANITTTLNIYTHLEQQIIDDCSDIN